MGKNRKYKLIGPFREVLTMENVPIKGSVADSQLKIIRNAGILLEGEAVTSIRSFEVLLREIDSSQMELVPVSKDAVVIPGMVDTHTHIAFAGTRAKDFALRNAGSSYLEIAENGGGIWSTVQDTRAATEGELVQLIAQRAEQLMRQGVTTIEVKSGYGLSVNEELKILRAIKRAKSVCAADLVATCLAAHTLPKDFVGTPADYLNDMVDQLFPMLIEEHLANRIDAFVEQSAFSQEQIIPYFYSARDMGFDLVVHADQFSVSGSELAVRVNALSADHLEASGEKEIQLLADSEVIPVALPGASMGLGYGFTPARKLLDAGASLAIATDWNPGSAPMGHLLTQASVLASFEKLSNAEVFAAVTNRAASALGLSDRGVLAAGKKADFAVFETDNIQEITYRQGRMEPIQVWVNGRIVFERE